MRSITLTVVLSLLLPGAALAADWEDRLADTLLAAEQDPVLAALRTEQPRATRAGHLRFLGPHANQPAAMPVLLDRLANGDEPVAVRAALADVVGRFADGWGDALVELIAEEPASSVRAVLVYGLRNVDADTARVGFSLALLDVSPEVRAEAARLAARRGDGLVVAPELVGRLKDSEASVRAAAANSLGVLAAVSAASDLLPLLDDASADVRLQALRALSRIEPSAVSAPRLRALSADPEPRVSRAASKLLSVSAP